MSEPKSSAPKFGSFKPKPAPKQPVQSPSDKTEDKDSLKVRSNRSDREENRGHREHHKSHRSSSKERRRDTSNNQYAAHASKTLVQVPERRKSLPSQKPEYDELFVIDRKGDVKILQFGSNHRYSVPPFHRTGAGRVLGSPSFVRIDRDYGDEKGLVLLDRRSFNSNRREKYIFAKLERERPRLLKIRPDISLADTVNQEADFVSLLSSRGKKRKRSVGGMNSDSEDESSDFRSIHGKAKPKSEPEDGVLQFVTDSESSGSETGRAIRLDTATRIKSAELSRGVEQRPHDFDAWLALIEHQDAMIRAAGDQRRITHAELRSTADIKIHLYEKALKNARSLGDRETLLLGLMTEGSKIWEVKFQSERWEQISKDNIDSLLLWKSYLNFKQTAFGTFQYEDIRETFVQRIRILMRAAGAEGARSDLQYQIIYVVLRLSVFMRESGYSEQAVAIWQAILEFNFFSPSKSVPHEHKTHLFEDFWESEVPRLGEEAAMGWCHFVENEGTTKVPEAANDEEGDALGRRTLFKSWASVEHVRMEHSRLPARTMDEVAEDDPFRVILASDIEGFLITFPKELQTTLLNAFLLFCNLSPIDSESQTSQKWFSDAFIGAGFLEMDSTWLGQRYDPEHSHPSDEDAQIHISSVLNSPSANFQASPESMFSLSWFKRSQPWEEAYGGDKGSVRYEWVRYSIKQLVQACFTEELAEHYLAFEWQNEPETIKKISKNLLKQHPSCLRLYNAYAMIEWDKGNKDAANSVFSAALEMSRALAQPGRDDSIILWKSWTWAHLEVSENTSALNCLLSIESGVRNNILSPSPFQLLKSKQYLEQRRDYNLYSGGQKQFAIIYAELLVLLAYLTSNSSTETRSSMQGDITAALAVHTSFSDILKKTLDDRKSDRSTHELFLQFSARLLYHHCRIGPFRPALLRQHLANYLVLYPQNTIFLSLYTFNEARLRIDNRVRNILSSNILTPANDVLSSRLFTIRYELKHGTIHSARAAFEHAVAAPSSRSSPGLWRLYMLYILQTPQFASQAKDVWYRALRACPWAKELFIFGFERLGEKLEFEELKSTWKVMGEKGLRVHVDLEDIFDEMKAVEESSGRKRIAHN